MFAWERDIAASLALVVFTLFDLRYELFRDSRTAPQKSEAVPRESESHGLGSSTPVFYYITYDDI